MPKVIAIGETVIDLIASKPVSYEEAEFFQKCFGGAPMNTAIGMARLGVDVGVITAVGDDPFGRFAIKTLRDNFVDTTYVKIKKGLRTTLAFVANEPETGERKFIFYRKPWCETADSNLTLEDIPLAYVKSAKFLHISGFILSQEPSRSTILQVVKKVKEFGVKISFDPTLRLDVWNSKEEMHKVYQEILKLSDIASFSKEEAEEILGSSEPKKAVDIALNIGISLVGLKRGVEGSIIATKNGELIETPAFKVKAIDTTGAGDAWNAGLLTGLIKGWDLKTCAIVANAIGAIVVTAKGAITAMPNKEKLKIFLMKRRIKLP
ncbi:MAG: sugar kinase [Candidatus Bathyarchaeia archaeon]